ncbi:hypothetical protein [Paenibacillus sp. NEAU-GSW1]|uniref:hypothetical protein n=1 Tax=Paenibacillus sp. NEAU-GSW1 TaxID=2682486 RepID=UPI0012E10BC2|nr:hypothetical protein [Paenibacillus sp. NEAU-GSW1]MUT66059.1 hypothetical protein [Paenibacillus sp. NEAU-GSW1]
MEENTRESGLQQGYYAGLFARFLWLFLIYFIFHSLIFYVFGYNVFTFYILAIVFSFFINTSLPIRGNYPFFRHALILFSLFYVNRQFSEVIFNKIYSFYEPSILWSILTCVSFVVGIASSFGRYGNGLKSRDVESISNFIGLLIIIAMFILFWWQGGVVFILFRIILVAIENSIAKLILYSMSRRYDNYETIETNNAP